MSRIEDDGSAEELADLLEAGQSVIVAEGGKGGKGNARFATSTRQAPRIAESGQRTKDVRLVLDLRLIADVGIVGLPNAGKSTLLRAMSAAKPQVADYPFTTLEPNLGVVEWRYDTFVAADIPGLIEGASEGAGLGLDFLRHIERTKVILHLLDGSRDDPAADRATIEAELSAYNPQLVERPHVIAVNKADLPEVDERAKELRKAVVRKGEEAFVISAATGEGVEKLVDAVARLVREARVEEERRSAEKKPVLRPAARRKRFEISRDGNAFVIGGESIVTSIEMLGADSEEAFAEVLHRLTVFGAANGLKRAGAKPGDRVRIGEVEIEWPG